MNRRSYNVGFITTHMARNAGRKVKGAARDAAHGVGLLGRFARSTVVGAAQGTKNCVLSAKAGAKAGWNSF